MGEVIGLLILAFVGYKIWEGYHEEMRPPPLMVDNGHGAKEPVCAHCSTRLVVLTRNSSVGFLSIVGGLVAIVGVGVLILVNWLAGGVMILIGVLVAHLGKSTDTVLTCPSCGKDAKTLR